MNREPIDPRPDAPRPDTQEAADLLAAPAVKRVHAIGHLPVALEVRRQALREIDQACREELDDDETDIE